MVTWALVRYPQGTCTPQLLPRSCPPIPLHLALQELTMVTWALARYHQGTSESPGISYITKVDAGLRETLMGRVVDIMDKLNASEVGLGLKKKGWFLGGR